MLTHTRGGFQRFTIGLLFALSLCLAGGLLMVMQAQAGGRDGQPLGASRTTPPVGSALHGSMAPLNPAFLESLVRPPIGALSRAAGGRALGERPTPQDFSYTRGMQVPGMRVRGTLPATYDLRTLGRVTSVKNQSPYGTCWAFASCGSLESGLLPGETRDFSEDNMVLTSGFNYPGTLYDAGGQFLMSTAYLVRWGGPVNESDDAYADGTTPPGLIPRKHVQEVKWIPARGSALDNDNVKNAVMQYGGAYVSMGWYDSSAGSFYYNASTASYYYNGSSDTNHGVLIVGWDDNYAAANFATAPPGDGAFIVKNSWGSAWGNSGYFYVSYYDSLFGRTGLMAVFNNAESTSNYTGIYQYDPLGDSTEYGYSSPTGWFANVFTAKATASLSAAGFYTVSPGTSYEVYTGSSLATLTLRTSGTLAYMGYHTVTLPAPVAVTNGQPFVVAVKVTSPGTTNPIAIEYPFAGYSSGATASAGQSYVSSNGSSWTDMTTMYGNTNVCLKAYVKTPVTPKITLSALLAGASWPIASTQTVSWTLNAAASTGEFRVWLVSAAGAWYLSKPVTPVAGKTSYSTSVPISVPAGAGYRVCVGWRADLALWKFPAQSYSAGFTVTPKITLSAPLAGASWPVASTQTVSWTLNSAVSAGELRVWLVSAAGAWYLSKPVTPVAGKTSYSTSVPVSVPAGASYRVCVGWRADLALWKFPAQGYSAGFTVTP